MRILTILLWAMLDAGGGLDCVAATEVSQAASARQSVTRGGQK